MVADLVIYIATFWAVVIGVPLLIIAWKQVLVIFGIPLGFLALYLLRFGEWNVSEELITEVLKGIATLLLATPIVVIPAFILYWCLLLIMKWWDSLKIRS